MSYRRSELTLPVPLQDAIEACKRAATAMGWRLAHESPQQLYFVEPHFILGGRGLIRLRRRWWLNRVETRVTLEPEEGGTHARFEWQRFGLSRLQSRQVDQESAMFLGHLFPAGWQNDSAVRDGGDSSQSPTKTIEDGSNP